MGQGYPTPFEAPCTGTPGRPVVRKISTLLSASKMRELRHRTSKPALDGLQCALFGFGLFSLSLFFSPPSDCSFLSSTMTWAPCPHGVRTRGKKSSLRFCTSYLGTQKEFCAQSTSSQNPSSKSSETANGETGCVFSPCLSVGGPACPAIMGLRIILTT